MRNAATVLLVFLAALAATVALQVHGGAYEAEYTETSDESAHYVTGLLVHDFVATGMPRPVGNFFRAFRNRYSNVGIGHWPPGFYILQAAWTLPFGTSRESILLLMAACNAALLTASYFLIKGVLPRRYALASALFLLTIPSAQISARSLMGEAPMALIELGAVAAFRMYLKRERAQDSALFGALAAAALLTKGTGIMLATVPPLGALLYGRLRLFVRWQFWLPAGMVLALCIPWYLNVPGALHDQVAFLGGLVFLPHRLPETLVYLRDNMGVPALAAAGAGMVLTIRSLARSEKLDPIWPLALVVVAASISFRSFVAVWEPRHLLTAMPWILLLAAEGVRRIVSRGGLMSGAVACASVIAVAAYPAWNVWTTPAKAHLGLDEAALAILATPAMERSSLLIISDLRGEGVFTAEIAGHERRPGHRVLRGSQVLADTSFLGDEYSPRFRDAAELMRYLSSVAPLTLVLDDPAEPFPHAKLMQEAIAANPAAWQRAGAHDSPRGPIEIWRLR